MIKRLFHGMLVLLKVELMMWIFLFGLAGIVYLMQLF